MADIGQVLATGGTALVSAAAGAGLTYWLGALNRRHQEAREDKTRFILIFLDQRRRKDEKKRLFLVGKRARRWRAITSQAGELRLVAGDEGDHRLVGRPLGRSGR
jgi:hypothetical protein